jgi:signal peptidase I
MSDLSNQVLPTALDVALNGKSDKKKKPTIGPVRFQLEALGVAILAAVLLKWFCLEAFQIPTSSMQPTLMGSKEAGVYDRILVNKLIQLWRDPQRWDITVFKYPLQKNQNYVKRLVGMPGDRLSIAGGNLWLVKDEGGKRTYEILRKPDDLQEAMWKNVYPSRMQARAETKSLGQVIGASPSSAFSETDETITADLSGSMLLFLRDEADGGMLDRVWDGYPIEVMQAMRDGQPFDQPQEIVPDVRIAAAITAEQALDELAFDVVVARPKFDTTTYSLAMKGGKGQLVVKVKDKPVAQSPEFALAIAPGATSEITFAHVDAQLIAWLDGAELARFEVAPEWESRDGCELWNETTKKLDLGAARKVTPQITAKGKGKVRITNLRVDRDQHYTRMGAPEVIEVPADHYFMMGDNTLQSIDARGWTAITVGVDADGNIVPPDSAAATPAQHGRVVRGNKRAMPLDRDPDRDETPIAIPSRDSVVMIDEYGEILRLKGKVGANWGERIAFIKPGGQDGRDEWTAPETTMAPGVTFVPRADIQGRASLIFYPCRPFSWLLFNSWPGRFGFVR